ncbi:MAG: glutathione peroxidase [Sphingobium sp.]|nr:MAG: glutathione peroxidase [Sphingobium sp.]
MTLYDFSVRDASGVVRSLNAYRGQVVLVVNVASQCGFTPQYAGLEALYRAYRDRGFVVLGFPCNQFGAQEPGSDADIQTFCATRFDVSFPVFGKIDVNGKDTDPLYRWLTAQKRGLLGTRAIKWNFTKFAIGRDGMPFARYAPTVKPEALTKDIAMRL